MQSGVTTHGSEWADLVRQCCTVQATRRPTVLAVERTVTRLAEQEAALFAEASEAARLAALLPAATPVPAILRAPRRKTVKSAATPQPAPGPGMHYQVVQVAASGKGKGGK